MIDLTHTKQGRCAPAVRCASAVLFKLSLAMTGWLICVLLAVLTW